MKVILNKDVPNVGKRGEVANVAEGFARNYLFPRKLAIEASKGNLLNIERQRALEERHKEQRVASAQAAADKINGKTVTIKGKAGAGTKLFGAITHQHIADAIKQQLGADVDKRRIDLDKPIKSIGSYDIKLALHHNVFATVKLEIVTDEQA